MTALGLMLPLQQWKVKVKVKIAFWSFFNTEAIWLIVFLLPTCSRIHIQRRHASCRCTRPLPAKTGTITNFASKFEFTEIC